MDLDLLDKCDTQLPTNTNVEEFLLTRFVMFSPVGDKRVVVPFDIIDPQYFRRLLQDFPEAKIEDLRGGVPFLPDWDRLSGSSIRGPIGEVHVDLDKFISEPKINLKGKETTCELTGEVIANLF